MNNKLYEAVMLGVRNALNEVRRLDDPHYISYADRKQWGIKLEDLP